MKKLSLFVLCVLWLLSISAACGKKIATNPSAATPTPTFTPTSTPGCIQATALPTVVYSVPNPTPVATPFGTPVVSSFSTPTAMGYTDNASHNTALLLSLPDWNAYWTDLGLSVPTAPIDFSTQMVLVFDQYGLDHICYTATNVVVYQTYVSPGTQMLPLPGYTPPTTFQKNMFLVPKSGLPVSFVSQYIYGM